MGHFSFPKVHLLLVDLFDHKDREILPGVAFRIEMTSHWLFQTSMFNVRSMVVHSYVEHVLWFSHILFVTFCTLNHVDHVSRLTVSHGFYWICFPNDRALYWICFPGDRALITPVLVHIIHKHLGEYCGYLTQLFVELFNIYFVLILYT